MTPHLAFPSDCTLAATALELSTVMFAKKVRPLAGLMQINAMAAVISGTIIVLLQTVDVLVRFQYAFHSNYIFTK